MPKGNLNDESEEAILAPGTPGTPYGTGELPLKEPEHSRWDVLGRLPRRHYVALLAFLGFGNIYALRANLSIAIISMTKNRTIVRNGTQVELIGEFHEWTSVTQGMILSSFFYGYILTQLPGGWLASRYGGRLLYGGGVLGTSLLTMMTPPIAHMGTVSLMAVRVLEGVCEGVTYPSIHALWSHWAPPAEKTKLATFAFAGSYFGTVVSMPLSAALAEHFGWPSVFYFFGLMALLWCSVWFKTISETPAEDPNISKREQQYIQESIGFTYQQVHDQKPPWRSMLTSAPVWAIVAAHFCENWGFYTMLAYLPRFLKDALGFRLDAAGALTAMPYFLMGVVVISGGQMADYLRDRKHWPTGVVRRLFCCGAFLCQTVFILLTAHSGTYVMAVLSVTLAIGLGGFAWAGFSVNHLDIAPQHASVLMGLSNTFATLPGMISPVLVGAITSTGDVWEWRAVFYIVATIYATGAVVYLLFSSGERAAWAEVPGGYMSRLDDLHERSETAD